MSPPTRAPTAALVQPPKPDSPPRDRKAEPSPDAAPGPTSFPPTESAKSRFRGSRLDDRRVLAAGGGLLLVIAAALFVALGGLGSNRASQPAKHGTKRAAAAPTASASPSATASPVEVSQPPKSGARTSGATPAEETTRQLAKLDSILTLAQTGRRAVTNGDLAAAIANRRSVLEILNVLHPNAELLPSVRALQAAERYSLHADTTCGLHCPPSTSEQATQLKRAFVAIFNPIATRYGTPTYAAEQI